MMTTTTLLLLMVLVVPPAHSADLYVSVFGAPTGSGTLNNPFNSLATALAAAEPYDTILLLPGAYSGSPNFPTITKPVTVGSTEGAASTVLSGRGDSSMTLTLGASGVVLSGLTVTNSGGVIATAPNASLVLCNITNNAIGLWVRTQGVVAANTTFRNNGGSSCSSDCTTYGKGGIVLDANAQLGLFYCALIGNRPTAISFIKQSTLFVADSTFMANGISSCYGGALCAYQSTATLVNCSFIENVAGRGGAIHLTNAALTNSHLTLFNNSASSGGGVYLTSASTYNDKASLYQANSYVSLAPIIVSYTHTHKLIHKTFQYQHRANSGSGGAFYLGSSSDVSLFSGVVSKNSATYDGGDFHCESGSGVYLTSCSVSDNRAPQPSTCRISPRLV